MPNEISQDITFSTTKNGASVNFANRKFFNMAGQDMIQVAREITTAAVQLSFGSITGAPRTLIIKNLDTTNFVEIGGDNTLSGFKLKILPNDCCVIQPSSATVWARANTASCFVQIVAIEE